MAKRTFESPSSCPVCGGGLVIAEMCCDSCGTEIRGRFLQTEFARLGMDDLRFLRAFIAARGSIKDVEVLLGISYPTVRARLEKLIETLGLSPSRRAEEELKTELDERRSEVLARLKQGELTVDEAERLLGELKF